MHKSSIFPFIFLTAFVLMSNSLRGMEGDPVKNFKASITEANKALDKAQLLVAINTITSQLEELSSEKLKKLLLFLGKQIRGLDSHELEVQSEQSNSTTATQGNSFWDWPVQDNDSENDASCADLWPLVAGSSSSSSNSTSGNSDAWNWSSPRTSSSGSTRSTNYNDENDENNTVIAALAIGGAIVVAVGCLLWCFCRKNDADDSQLCVYSQDAAQRLAGLMETIVHILRDRDQAPIVNRVTPRLQEFARNSITLRGALDKIAL